MSLIVGVSNMLDNMPDELLVEIISYLNARDKLKLANLCQRLNRLVFEEKRLLRSLNFSKDGYLTTASQLQRYFDKKTKYLEVRRINISNIYCTGPSKVLQNISKAINVVELNIIGSNFISFEKLANFLTPFKKLEKLSLNWPSHLGDLPSLSSWDQVVGRLTYLKVLVVSPEFMKTLMYRLGECRELEELYIAARQRRAYVPSVDNIPRARRKLNKLKIAAVDGQQAKFLAMGLFSWLPDMEDWRIFKSQSHSHEIYYFDKKLKVSQRSNDDVEFHQRVSYNEFMELSDNFVSVNSFLEDVIKRRGLTAPTNLCCLSEYSCLLTIYDMNMLIKNHEHKISYLWINHNVETNCDVHLLGSLFPTVKKLVFTDALKTEESTVSTSSFDISFKKLVEHTPCLEELIICVSPQGVCSSWDWRALEMIGGWKRLSSLYLANLPIRNGQFLLRIVKDCPSLEKLRLDDLGPSAVCCYVNELRNMLSAASNLKDFSLRQNNLGQVAKIFDALAKNDKLRRISVFSSGSGNNVDNLSLQIIRVARCCSLKLLVCKIEGMTKTACRTLKSTLQRLKANHKKPDFQFDIISTVQTGSASNTNSETVLSDYDISHFRNAHKDLLESFYFKDDLMLLHS